MFAGTFLTIPPLAEGGSMTDIAVTAIITVGVIVTAVFSYLGVRGAKAAKIEAKSTRDENSADHGRVARALMDLVAEFREHRATTGRRFDELGQSIGAVREAHMRHLEHHIEHPTSKED